MKKSKIFLAVLAVVLAVGVSIGPAMAYFTTYVTATGNTAVYTGPHSRIDETYDGVKHATIHNYSDSVSVYIRAKVYSVYPVALSGTNWSSAGNDEYSYYSEIVPPDGTTQALDIEIHDVPKADATNEGVSYNVIVVYECVPVLYDPDGNRLAADWSQKWTVITEGGNG